MKTKILVLLSLTSLLFATVPDHISFNSMVFDNNDNPLTNSTISIKLELLDSSDSVLYTEYNTSITTDDKGLISLKMGAYSNSYFHTLDFDNVKSIRISRDLSGGSNYTDIITEEISTVPFAFTCKELSGNNTSAAGVQAQAWGINTNANNDASTAFGYNTNADNTLATAWGTETNASGYLSTTWGSGNIASNDAGTAWGMDNNASGIRSTTWGNGNTANYYASTAWGYYSNALNNYATSFGIGTTASGLSSTAWGQGTTANGYYSTAWGQDTNASGYYSTAFGANTIADGNHSLAIGNGSWAQHDGTVVFSDGNDKSFHTAQENQFLAQFENGYHFYTSGYSVGSRLPGGGGGWTTLSDRNSKENIEEVDGEVLLETLSNIPIMRWNYITQDDHIKHIGPFSQDFYAAFNVGDDDLSISTIDPAGIALRAIQQLHETQKELKAKTEMIDELQAEIKAIKMAIKEAGISLKE